MDKYVLCTLGTSVANKFDRKVLNAKQRENGKWDDRDPEFEKALHGLVDGFLNGKDDFSVNSAESAILKKVGLSEGDHVVLLATDSYLGRVCAEETARLIANGFGLPDDAVETVRVEGLQVADAERLRRVGLPNFVREVDRRVNANSDYRYQYDIMLCPVGGYKGVIPFLTVLGMAHRLPVLYTFEHIDSLVRLPQLPFSLDRDLYARAKDALREIGERAEMPEAEFLAKVKGYTEDERDSFLAFVEPSSTPGFVTSGAFTETFAPDFECSTAPLSQKAIEDIDNLGGTQLYRAACRLVMDLQDQNFREGVKGNHKKTESTDLQIIKQGNSSLRVLGYVNAGRFMVCRVLMHEDYDRVLDSHKCRRANFPADSFVEWTPPPEELPESVKDEESPYDAAMRKLEDAEKKLQDTVSEWAGKVNDQTAKREAAEKGMATVQKKLADTKKSVKDLEQENARIKAKLEEEDLDFWRKRRELESDNGRLASELADRKTQVESLEREKAEALAALAEANGRLAELDNLGFFKRLRRVFR